jgi:kinesin family protein 18/19
MDLVHQGNSIRRTEGTAANPVSSRSHAVLQVVCEQKGRTRAGGKAALRCSKLSLIDLAGSERVSHTRLARKERGDAVSSSSFAGE